MALAFGLSLAPSLTHARRKIIEGRCALGSTGWTEAARAPGTDTTGQGGCFGELEGEEAKSTG